MLTAIKHVAADNFVFNRTAHWHIMHATQSTLNCTSFNYALQLNSPAVKPTDYAIQRFTH